MIYKIFDHVHGRKTVGGGLKKYVMILIFLSLFLPACSALKNFDRRSSYGEPLSKEDLKTIYETWFENPYEYMFESCDKEKMLLGGVNGILFYGGLLDGFARQLGIDRSHRFYDLKLVEKAAKLPILLKEEEFGYYNPEIIVWGYENLIPSPEDRFRRETYRYVYQRVFKRFFRLMTESYLYLDKYCVIEDDSRKYKEIVVEGQFEALTYLDKEYGNLLSEYDYGTGYSYWTVGMSFGFWLRRHLDGTDEYVWEGLTKLMNLYDTEWFEGKLINGPSTM